MSAVETAFMNFVIFTFISVQVALQHLGLDRSLSLKRNLQVKAQFSPDTVASVLPCGLAFIMRLKCILFKKFWEEYPEICRDHKVMYIFRESQFLKKVY